MFTTPKKAKKREKKSWRWRYFGQNYQKNEKNINTEIFKEYFRYQNLLFLGEILHITKKSRKKLIIDRLNNALILLKKSLTLINSKKVKDLKY